MSTPPLIAPLFLVAEGPIALSPADVVASPEFGLTLGEALASVVAGAAPILPPSVPVASPPPDLLGAKHA